MATYAEMKESACEGLHNKMKNIPCISGRRQHKIYLSLEQEIFRKDKRIKSK